MAWRDQKIKARADVHRAFRVSAVYLTHTAGTPVPCSVRIHSKVAANEAEFTFPTSPGYFEIDPVVIFDAFEVTSPLFNSYLVIGSGEIYRLGAVEPNREGYIRADMVRLKPDDCVVLLAAVNETDPAWVGIL